jgi:hypothetical protein
MTQLNTDLSALGTVDVCEYVDSAENAIVIVISGFTESLDNVDLVNTHIVNNVGNDYIYIVSQTMTNGLFKLNVNRDDGKAKLIYNSI